MNFVRLISGVVAIAVIAMASTAGAVTVWSEDFEGGANPQPLTTAPFSWTTNTSGNQFPLTVGTQAPNPYVGITQIRTSTGQGILGNAHTSLNRNFALSTTPIPHYSAGTGNVTTISGNSYVVPSHSSGSGHGGLHYGSTSAASNKALEYGMDYSRNARGAQDGWRHRSNFLSGQGAEKSGNGALLGNEEVLISFGHDTGTMMTFGSVASVADPTQRHDFVGHPITDLTNLGLTDPTIQVFEDHQGAGAPDQGIDFDNLAVTQTPEPSTLALVLLGLCGLAMLIRRRR